MQDAEQATESTALQAGGATVPVDPVLPPNMLASLLMVAGIMLIIYILMRRLYRRNKQQKAQAGVTSREKIEAARVRATAKREGFEQYMAEAEELTRRLAATLDNKAARLEILIDEAEEKIAQLESTSHGVAGIEDSKDQSPRNTGRPRLDPTLLDRARLHQQTRERDGTEPAPVDEAADLLQRMYELADTGLTPVEIAGKLDQPVGQVELVLNLRRQTG